MSDTSPIVITGGAQRLGLAIAESLLNQGQAVIFTYRTPRPGVQNLVDKGAIAVQADFVTDDGVKAFIDFVKKSTKRLRGIIHNASDWVAESADCNPSELINRMMQIHVNAPYQINLALSDLLILEDGYTDIIHMTDYVQDKGSKKHIAYSASKAALHNLTLSFAAALAPRVKVNSIAPALVMFNDDDSDEYKAKALEKSLLQNCPGAEEAVKAVEYLLRSEYVTGRTLFLDGGRPLK